MKIFIKNNVKIMVAIIVTAVLCVSGTVYATTKYLSSDVTYKGTTVENALNDLYDYNENNKCVKGTFSHSANSQLEIYIGFEPSILMFTHTIFNNEYDYTVYDKRYNNNIWYAHYSNSSNGVELDNNMKVENNVLTTSYPTSWWRYKSAYSGYYIACK